MGPDKNKNSGATFEHMIDSIFFGEGGAERERVDDAYVEYSDDQDDEEEQSDEE